MEEFEFKWYRLGTIIHEKGWLLSTFAHVQSAEVEGALLTTTFFKDNGKVLLDTSCCHLYCLRGMLLSFDVDLDML